MYRVIDVAKKLGVSKVTIYKKVNKNKKALRNHVHMRSNITYIDDIGVAIIKDTIEVSALNLSGTGNDIEAIKRNYLEDLSKAIDYLSHQIEIKKLQIQKKDEILAHYIKGDQAN